jgi:hypothetical protein
MLPRRYVAQVRDRLTVHLKRAKYIALPRGVMKKLHDSSTAWCEPSDSTNSDHAAKEWHRTLLSGLGSENQSVFVYALGRPAWGSGPCPASFLALYSFRCGLRCL